MSSVPCFCVVWGMQKSTSRVLISTSQIGRSNAGTGVAIQEEVSYSTADIIGFQQ